MANNDHQGGVMINRVVLGCVEINKGQQGCVMVIRGQQGEIEARNEHSRSTEVVKRIFNGEILPPGVIVA